MYREKLIVELGHIVELAKVLTPKKVAAIKAMLWQRKLYKWRRTIGSSETN
jgi:hypothetical protein